MTQGSRRRRHRHHHRHPNDDAMTDNKENHYKNSQYLVSTYLTQVLYVC